MRDLPPPGASTHATPASPLRLALFEPDIPQNAGTLFRLGACFAVPVDIIEPAGFDVSDRKLKRAGMDYIERAYITRHLSFDHFETWRRASNQRLVLASSRGDLSYINFAFAPGDIVLLGRESAGVPESVRESADQIVTIPMRAGLRSLNIALAGAIVIAEAMRQLGAFAAFERDILQGAGAAPQPRSEA